MAGDFPLPMADLKATRSASQALQAAGALPDQVHMRDGTFPLLLALRHTQNGHAECVQLHEGWGPTPELLQSVATLHVSALAIRILQIVFFMFMTCMYIHVVLRPWRDHSS